MSVRIINTLYKKSEINKPEWFDIFLFWLPYGVINTNVYIWPPNAVFNSFIINNKIYKLKGL